MNEHTAPPSARPGPGPSMGRLARRAAWLGGLAAVWVLLNGEPSAGNVVGGLLVATGVLVLAPVAAPRRHHDVHPLAALRFLLFVLGSLVTSSLAVAATSLRPTDARLRAGFVRVELPGATPLVTTLVANAITLTPGTLTVTADADADADASVLHVHVLGLADPEAFRAEIAELHARATAAFTPRPPVEPAPAPEENP